MNEEFMKAMSLINKINPESSEDTNTTDITNVNAFLKKQLLSQICGLNKDLKDSKVNSENDDFKESLDTLEKIKDTVDNMQSDD